MAIVSELQRLTGREVINKSQTRQPVSLIKVQVTAQTITGLQEGNKYFYAAGNMHWLSATFMREGRLNHYVFLQVCGAGILCIKFDSGLARSC